MQCNVRSDVDDVRDEGGREVVCGGTEPRIWDTEARLGTLRLGTQRPDLGHKDQTSDTEVTVTATDPGTRNTRSNSRPQPVE